jgi:hypothetical protein
MAGPVSWTEELIARRVKDGRGKGTGKGYSPWLFVQEFSSKGTQTRVPSVKVGRTIHTFSYLERALFLYTEFQSNFGDFQEQYPMERSVTLGAAKTLGIQHPRYPHSRVPVVMSLDAVVTMRDADGKDRIAAWDVKPARQLLKKRVAEKLSLHKAYCAHHNMSHYLFTENSVSRNVVRNIDWIRMSLPKDGELALVPGLFTWHPDQMLEQLATSRKSTTITRFCSQYDFENKLECGTGLRILKLLLWDHRIEANMDAKWIEREPIPRPAHGWKSALLRKAA